MLYTGTGLCVILVNVLVNSTKLPIFCDTSGASPGFGRGGGQEFVFLRFVNLHVAKRHAAHGEAMRLARGVRGHAPPRKFL